MGTTIEKRIQQVSPSINEENVIDDTIFELIGDDELAQLFRLYDKLKNRIPPGKIVRNGDGSTIANEAEYGTHAYLVANSKNFLSAESMLYSNSEVNNLVAQNLILSSSYLQLEAQTEAMFVIFESFQNVIKSLNTTLSNIMVSGSNIPQNVAKYYEVLNMFALNSITETIKGYQFNANQFYMNSQVPAEKSAVNQDTGKTYGGANDTGAAGAAGSTGSGGGSEETTNRGQNRDNERA